MRLGYRFRLQTFHSLIFDGDDDSKSPALAPHRPDCRCRVRAVEITFDL